MHIYIVSAYKFIRIFTVLLLIQGGLIDSFAKIGETVSGATTSSSLAAGDEPKIKQSVIQEDSTKTKVTLESFFGA